MEAIDRTHFDIKKPTIALEDYFYFKIGGYSMHCQAIIEKNKRFLDVYVGMPGSMNDSCVLKGSTLYRLTRSINLFDEALSQEGFSLSPRRQRILMSSLAYYSTLRPSK